MKTLIHDVILVAFTLAIVEYLKIDMARFTATLVMFSFFHVIRKLNKINDKVEK